ncbi:MAG: glycosyltransferase [Fulvivirga sp.]
MESKKKLFYLSFTSFAQVDLGIIPYLNSEYEITYCVVIPRIGSNYSKKELEATCNRYNIKFLPIVLTKRQRDIRLCFEFFRVIQHIKSINPEIIYSVSLDNPIVAVVSLFFDRKKTVIFIHDVEHHSSYPQVKFLKLGRLIVTSYFKYFQVFSENQKQIFNRKYPTKLVSSIPVPLSNYTNNSKVTFKGSKKRFLFFGNILPYKGLDILIKAINNLSVKHSNFELVIAGRCTDWTDKYEPLVKGNKNITAIIRHIKNEEIESLFSKSHYLILPYRDATQSGPLMIAYNYCLPVIVSNIKAFEEVVEEGVSGYFFSNDKDIEAVLSLALERSNAEYGILKEKLKFFVNSKYSPEIMNKRYASMFSELE